MRLLPLLLLASLLTTLASCRAANSARRGGGHRQAPAPQVAVTARADQFGVAGSVGGKEAPALLRELGVGWIRFPVSWSQVEPRPGEYRWQRIDDAVSAREPREPLVMLTLMSVSPWATTRQKSVRERRVSAPPKDMQAYYDFVYGLVRRAKGAVGCWQIENEEESQNWWAGSPDEYIALLRTAHRAIRAADPEATIALGGFTSEITTVAALAAEGASNEEIARSLGHRGPIKNLREAEASLRAQVDAMTTILARAKDYVDVVDIHLYNEYQTIPARVAWLREQMRANGYEKPIWATEVGGPDTLVVPHSDDTNAQEVVKRVALCLASGVQKVFWLNLMESEATGAQVGRFDRMALVRHSGRRKPSFYAYQTTIRQLEGMAFESSLSVPGGYGLRFGRGTHTVWVLWADRGQEIELETGTPTAQVVYTDGRSETRQTENGSARLTLTAAPVFVAADRG